MSMKKELLLEIVADQRNIVVRNNLVKRESFCIDEKSSFIQIFSGIRRSGKSTLLQVIRQNSTEQDYYFNFDDDRLISFNLEDFQMLYEIFLEQFGEQKTFYFDEIQNIPNWEKFVRRLHDYGHKIFITGSNANLLSSELGTRLTGRYLQTEIFPFSFSEFLQLKNKIAIPKLFSSVEKMKFKDLFIQFQEQGGFPEFLQTQNIDYLHSLYEGILYRDILTRYKLPFEKPLRELVQFCASNIGKLVSYNKLKTLIGLSNANSVKEYLYYLEQSYLFFSISRFDYSLKKQAAANKKIYCIDNKLASEIGFRSSSDEGRFLENTVFLELRRSYKNIFYHKDNFECDFLIQEKNTITQAVQVCLLLHEENKKRELGGIIEACKAYKLKEGIILSLEQEESFIEQGVNIRITPVWKWLLRKNYDNKITASFDVSTKEGKEKCLQGFKNLM